MIEKHKDYKKKIMILIMYHKLPKFFHLENFLRITYDIFKIY